MIAIGAHSNSVAASLAGLLLALGVSTAAAQSPNAASPCLADSAAMATPDRLPDFTVRQLPGTSVRSLRASLKNGCWSKALGTFYSVFRPDLPDWIVYIDSAGVIRQTFIHGRDDDSTSRVLHAERYIWLSIFSDRPMREELAADEGREDAAIKRVCSAGPSGGGSAASGGARPNVLSSDTSDLRFSRRLIAYRRDPIVSLLIKGLTRLVGVDPGSDPAAMDSTRLIEMNQVSADTATERMYGGFGRFGLIENAQVELSLAAVRCKAFPQAKAESAPAADTRGRIDFIYSDFANVKHRTFDLAVLTAVTLGPRVPTFGSNLQVTSESPRLSANAYLTVVYNMFDLGFPNGPFTHEPFWQRRPLGVFAGTNVARGNLADELVAGGVIGNLFGNAGTAIGCSWINSPRVEGGHTVGHMRPRLLVGFDLRL